MQKTDERVAYGALLSEKVGSAQQGFSGGASGEEPANAGDVKDSGAVPRSGRCPGEENGNPFQCSCLENPVDRGAWQATVYGMEESDTTQVIQHVCTAWW